MPSTERRHPNAARIIKILLGSVAGLVVLTLVGVGGFVYSLASSYNSQRHVLAEAFPKSGRPAATTGKAAQAVNILLLGTDVDAADPESPQFVGKREADTIMLLHVPADRRAVYAMSILRNSEVPIPGHGSNAINAAYAYGGAPLEVRTVEQLIGVRVDHVVELSLTGMRGFTDALGGTTVRTATAVTGKDGTVFPAGTTKLNGTQALSFLRAGNFKATGDSQRAADQEVYFQAVMNQVLSAKILLNPTAIGTAVSLLSPYLSTDQGFDAATVGTLGFSLRGLHGSDVHQLRLPTSGIGEIDGASVVNVDQVGLARVRLALRDDSMASLTP
jgi:LCP family protein required for cell wall assembly